jgi:predicted RNA-binding protein YlxR (DUF448 family)
MVAAPDELVRITVGADGIPVVGRAKPGRGAWLCRASALACLERATQRQAIARALRRELAPGALDSLRALLGDRARMEDRL